MAKPRCDWCGGRNSNVDSEFCRVCDRHRVALLRIVADHEARYERFLAGDYSVGQ